MIKNKTLSLIQLKKELHRLRKSGKTIAFTNGCFDILHFGHVAYLEKAKKNHRILVLGVNSDQSVRKIKGPTRPIVPQHERAAVLAALESVDYVTIFTEDTPYELIKMIVPDVLVKGGDWSIENIVGRDIVEQNGGLTTNIPFVVSRSTSSIIELILEKYR